MEYEKNNDKFSFGFGTQKIAGSGTLDKAVEAPDIPTKHNKKEIAKSAAKAAAAIGLIALKAKMSKKKR